MECRPFCYLLSRKGKIVEARLDGHGETRCAGLAEQRERRRSGEMDDVGSEIGEGGGAARDEGDGAGF